MAQGFKDKLPCRAAGASSEGNEVGASAGNGQSCLFALDRRRCALPYFLRVQEGRLEQALPPYVADFERGDDVAVHAGKLVEDEDECAAGARVERCNVGIAAAAAAAVCARAEGEDPFVEAVLEEGVLDPAHVLLAARQSRAETETAAAAAGCICSCGSSSK